MTWLHQLRLFWDAVWPNLAASALIFWPVFVWHHLKIRTLLEDRLREPASPRSPEQPGPS